MDEEDRLRKLEDGIVKLNKLVLCHEQEIRRLNKELKLREINKFLDNCIDNINRVGDSYA